MPSITGSSKGRLRPVFRGVYVVGRPGVTSQGRWMAAVLACGPGAVLSHDSAAALLGIGSEDGAEIEVSVAPGWDRRRPGIRVHRRRFGRHAIGTFDGIPVTSPAQTLIDLAAPPRPADRGADGRRGGPARPDHAAEAPGGARASPRRARRGAAAHVARPAHLPAHALAPRAAASCRWLGRSACRCR